MSEPTPAVERWAPVLGFEGRYQVSDQGRVWSDITQRVLSPGIHNGYPYVGLRTEGKQYTRRVHRLVLESFVGPQPPGMEACHWDGNRANARLDNLRWDTWGGNFADAVRHGTRPLCASRVAEEELARQQGASPA